MTSRKVVLITGCSSPQGIGFASARALAGAGHAVHATVRNHANDDALSAGLGDNLHIHNLDLRDRVEAQAVIAAIVQAEGRLDVVVNNAGYGVIGGVEQVELDVVRENFETNYFSTMALIQEVLPVMRHQKAGHIVNVSTIFDAGFAPPAIGYYIASKAALEVTCQALALEVAPWDIRVTNFQPGPVLTELERVWGERLSGDADPRPTLSDELYAWVQNAGPEPQSAEQVADALVALVGLDDPPLAAQSGPASERYVATALRDPSRQRELDAMLAAFRECAT
jgi:retinol dehydrogenase 8